MGCVARTALLNPATRKDKAELARVRGSLGRSKEFMGKRRLAGNAASAAASDDEQDLRGEARTLKEWLLI